VSRGSCTQGCRAVRVGLTGQATPSGRPPQAQLHYVKFVIRLLYVLLLPVSSVIVFIEYIHSC